ncbi:MAG: PEGA domain-containing protein [Myxococcales bacterium]
MIALAVGLALALAAPQRLAVLDLKPLGAPPDVAHTLTGVIAEEAGKIPGVTAMSQAEIGALLGLERQKQMLGCGDESCLAEIGGALGAKQVISGSLGKVGGSFVLQLELVDTAHARVAGRESRTLGDPGDLVMAARDLTHRLLTGQALDTTGKLKIVVAPGGAAVLLDGKRIGTSPLAAPIAMAEGRHKLLVEKDGYVGYEATVETVPGQTLFNEVQLVSIAPIAAARSHAAVRTLGWICLGVSAAAFASASYFGLQANAAFKNYQGAIYGTGDPSVQLYGASYYKGQTVSAQTPANVAFAAGGITAALALGLELWGYLAQPIVHGRVEAER